MQRPVNDQDEEDVVGLMSNVKLTSINDEDDDDAARIMSRRWAVLVLIVMLAAALAVVVPTRGTVSLFIVQYSCPASVGKSENYDARDNSIYVEATKEIQLNLTKYMDSFRNSSFDGWGKTYEEVKKGMYHWKKTRFAPNLKNGDSIYESACGIGLNLYMTLEIVNEVKNIESLVVYGNEYVPESVDVANAVFTENPPDRAIKGTICPGDSSHLYYVPSDAFDLVYTGYITPVMDPLHLGLGYKENTASYKKVCEGTEWQWKKLAELAQGTQEDFYGKWVAEMVRITKPGKPVIIEQVSLPLCEAEYDYGGVAKTWWVPAIQKYGWDVDLTSIEMEQDEIHKNRYHVFMRKNGK